MARAVSRSYSTIRNERVELLVHYALSSIDQKGWFVDRRFRVGPSGFCTEFDHRIIDNIRNLTFLGQTTCYKERGVIGGEPNKTYEMRETMMEYLLAHVNILFGESDLNIDNLRFFHIIVGDPAYSYSYFNKIRSKSYDHNIVLYPPQGIEELYIALEEALPEEILSDQKFALEELRKTVIHNKINIITETISQILKQFNNYIAIGCPQSVYGLLQAKAICNLAKERNIRSIEISHNLKPGIGIKNLYLKAAKGDINCCGNEIKKVVENIFKLRPFLLEAKKALENGTEGWEYYIDSLSKDINIDFKKSLFNVLFYFWNIDDIGKRALIRRMLIKLPSAITGEGTAYPQDIPIKGINERNIYKKIFDNNKTKKLINYLHNKYINVDIYTTKQLLKNMKSAGRYIIKRGFNYDIKNGTMVKPVRHYVVQNLQKIGYKIMKQRDSLGNTIKGYHGELFDVNIGPFNSMEVICTDNSEPIALFKAKYFRPPEFDRRVKEEGFISFTSAFTVDKKGSKIFLKHQYEELPRIMFIDTEPDWTPDPEPVKQLVRMGWDVFFDISDLIKFLEHSIYKMKNIKLEEN